MMDKQENRAINLTTSSNNGGDHNGGSTVNMDLREEVLTNGDVQGRINGSSPQGQGINLPHAATKSIPLATGSSKRKQRPQNFCSSADPMVSETQSILMLAAQHGLLPQQMHQLLQQQQANSGPVISQQVQQVMQQSVLAQQQQKLHEQLLQQLNEQLQINVLQQSQLMQQQQDKKSGNSKQLQQLALQQQQLIQNIQQIQLQQRQFLLASLVQPFGAPQGMMSPSEIQQLWKEVASQSGLEDQTLKTTMNGLGATASLAALLPGGTQGLLPQGPGSLFGVNGLHQDGYLMQGGLIGQPQVSFKLESKSNANDHINPLFRHGLCKWPGCDNQFEDYGSFLKHLNTEHVLDDRSTAQARVQMQVVNQLEVQLQREKELLLAMMQHLHMKPVRDREEREREAKAVAIAAAAAVELSMKLPVVTSPVSSPSKLPSSSASSQSLTSLSQRSPPTSISVPSLTSASGVGVASTTPTLLIPPPSTLSTSIAMSTSMSSHQQSSSQPTTPTGLGPMRRRVSDKSNLPISAEIQRNREFYKTTDVRPPFTYASLIRQAIIESPHKQLTLSEIYNWFYSTFAYFRRNEATWKNAVRHNLSLHKCFMRVENVKGAVWTVDEVEFYKRRPQKLTGAIVRSPSHTPDHPMYGDNLNASLRAALEHSSLLLSQQMSNGSITSMDGAEDLSMKNYNNSSDSTSKSGSPSRDEVFFPTVKEEPVNSRTGFEDRSPNNNNFDSQMEFNEGEDSSEAVSISRSETFSLNHSNALNKLNQSEALNLSPTGSLSGKDSPMTLNIPSSQVGDFSLGMTNGSAPRSSRISPVVQISSSEEMFSSSSIHSNNFSSVSHSVVS
ncbi:hypothetical protein ACJMK2_015685 [Sinanodonta woodiana]|uniref:Fork-head domain-containing protein n=1 Tax=Sinanodonta woodiana TaxID=1069815 RepID=A0ABD3USL6_SINWO